MLRIDFHTLIKDYSSPSIENSGMFHGLIYKVKISILVMQRG